MGNEVAAWRDRKAARDYSHLILGAGLGCCTIPSCMEECLGWCSCSWFCLRVCFDSERWPFRDFYSVIFSGVGRSYLVGNCLLVDHSVWREGGEQILQEPEQPIASNYHRAELVKAEKTLWPLLIPVNLLALSTVLALVVPMFMNLLGSPTAGVLFGLEISVMRWICAPVALLSIIWIAASGGKRMWLATLTYLPSFVIWFLVVDAVRGYSTSPANIVSGAFIGVLYGLFCLVGVAMLVGLFSLIFWASKKIASAIQKPKGL